MRTPLHPIRPPSKIRLYSGTFMKIKQLALVNSKYGRTFSLDYILRSKLSWEQRKPRRFTFSDSLPECFYVLCTRIHQHIEPTVVCAEFVTWIVVLLFMPKGSYFAGIHTAYRERQRNLTAHHYRTLFFAPARPFILATMSWREPKKKKGFPN